MNKFEDIIKKKRPKMLILIGTKEKVLARLKELAEEERKEIARVCIEKAKKTMIIRGIWNAMSDKEKEFVLAKSGYELSA